MSRAGKEFLTIHWDSSPKNFRSPPIYLRAERSRNKGPDKQMEMRFQFCFIQPDKNDEWTPRLQTPREGIPSLTLKKETRHHRMHHGLDPGSIRGWQSGKKSKKKAAVPASLWILREHFLPGSFKGKRGRKGGNNVSLSLEKFPAVLVEELRQKIRKELHLALSKSLLYLACWSFHSRRKFITFGFLCTCI